MIKKFLLVLQIIFLTFVLLIVGLFLYVVGSGRSHAQNQYLFDDVLAYNDSITDSNGNITFMGWAFDCKTGIGNSSIIDTRGFLYNHQTGVTSEQYFYGGPGLISRPDVVTAYQPYCNMNTNMLGYLLVPVSQPAAGNYTYTIILTNHEGKYESLVIPVTVN